MYTLMLSALLNFALREDLFSFTLEVQPIFNKKRREVSAVVLVFTREACRSHQANITTSCVCNEEAISL